VGWEIRDSESGTHGFFGMTCRFRFALEAGSPGSRNRVRGCARNTDFAPQGVSSSGGLRVRFLARVVRVEPQTRMRVGVGAAIEEYEFLRSEQDGSMRLQPGWSFRI
jgi:hypothetical protein